MKKQHHYRIFLLIWQNVTYPNDIIYDVHLIISWVSIIVLLVHPTSVCRPG